MDLEKYKKAASDIAAAKEAAAVADKTEEEARQKQETEQAVAEGESKFKELEQERAGVEQQLETVGSELASAKQKVEEATTFAETAAKELDDATRAEFERDFSNLKTELTSLESRASDLRTRKEAFDATLSGAEAAKAIGEALGDAAMLENRETDLERKRSIEVLTLLSPLADGGRLNSFEYLKESDLADPDFQKRYQTTPEQAQAIIDLKKDPKLAASFGQLFRDQFIAEPLSLDDIAETRKLYERKFEGQEIKEADEGRIRDAIDAQQQKLNNKIKQYKNYNQFLRKGLGRGVEADQILDSILDANTRLLNLSPDSTSTYLVQAELTGLLALESQQIEKAKTLLDQMEKLAKTQAYFFDTRGNSRRVKARGDTGFKDPSRKEIGDAVDRLRQKIKDAEGYAEK